MNIIITLIIIHFISRFICKRLEYIQYYKWCKKNLIYNNNENCKEIAIKSSQLYKIPIINILSIPAICILIILDNM